MKNPAEIYEENALRFAVQASNPNKNKFEYDLNMPSLLELTQNKRGLTLDFGCGAGNFSSILREQGREVEGCDGSPTLLDIAQQAYPDIKFFRWDGLTAAPTDKKYQLVFSKLVFHYITQLDTVLNNIAKSLEERGQLCFSVPHPEKTEPLVGSLKDEATYIDEVGNFGIETTMIHRTSSRYRQLLGACGLHIINQNTVYRDGLPMRLNILAAKD